MLKIDLEYEKEIFFIRLRGNLNNHNTKKINSYIVPVIKNHRIKKVIINLKDLKNIDSSGIYAISNIKCVTSINHGKLFLCNVSKSIRKSLNILNIKYTSSELMARKNMRCNNGL